IGSRIRQRAAERLLILAWVSDMGAAEDHDEVLERLGCRYFGAGSWLLNHPASERWSASRDGMLALRGSIGTGKSSLVSIVTERFLHESDDRIAFFYCSRTRISGDQVNSGRNTLTNIALSLLRQLC